MLGAITPTIITASGDGGSLVGSDLVNVRDRPGIAAVGRRLTDDVSTA